MTRLRPTLALLLLPLLTGCTSAYESQCDHLSELDEQVACLDTAFVQLRIGNTEAPEREARRGGDSECRDGDYAARGEDRYICDDGEWLPLDDRDEDGESDPNGGSGIVAADPGNRDQDDRDEEQAERPEEDEDFCSAASDEDQERCRGVVRDLDGLHERTREAVRQNGDSEQRRQLIREALRQGRDAVREETSRQGERERPEEERERPADEEERAP